MLRYVASTVPWVEIGAVGSSYGGASYGAGDRVTASEAAAAAAGLLLGRTTCWMGPPCPPGRGEVLRVPLDAVYTVGPGKTRPGPHNQLPVWISSALATPGVPWQAAAAAAGAGGVEDETHILLARAPVLLLHTYSYIRVYIRH